jgi:hypothetical protein
LAAQQLFEENQAEIPNNPNVAEVVAVREPVERNMLACELCGQLCKKKQGLAAHKRHKHANESS